MVEDERKRWRAMEEAQEKLGEESERYAEDLANQRALMMQNELDALADVQAQNALGYEMLKEANRDLLQQRMDEEQELQNQASALSSGRLGDAFGVKGIGGGVLNLFGSAASGYQRTGAVLQGAGQGMQASGGNPWGALIGAVVALLTQTAGRLGRVGGRQEEGQGGRRPGSERGPAPRAPSRLT